MEGNISLRRLKVEGYKIFFFFTAVLTTLTHFLIFLRPRITNFLRTCVNKLRIYTLNEQYDPETLVECRGNLPTKSPTHWYEPILFPVKKHLLVECDVSDQLLREISSSHKFLGFVWLIDLVLWLKMFIFHRCLDYILLNLTPACRRLLTSTQSGATLLEYRAQSDRYTWHRLTCTCIEGSSKGREHLVDPMVAKKQEKVNLQAQWKLIMVPFLCYFKIKPSSLRSSSVWRMFARDFKSGSNVISCQTWIWRWILGLFVACGASSYAFWIIFFNFRTSQSIRRCRFTGM